MKKVALFLVLMSTIFNGIVAMDNCGTCGQGLTSFGKKIIEGIGQDGLLFAGSLATFSAGAVVRSWVREKFEVYPDELKDAAKRGACVGAGLATATSLMRTVNTYPEMFNNAVKNNQNVMCGVVAGAALGYGLGNYFAPKKSNECKVKMYGKNNSQEFNLKKMISLGAAGLAAGGLYAIKDGAIAETIGKNILEHKYLTASLVAAGGAAYVRGEILKMLDDKKNHRPLDHNSIIGRILISQPMDCLFFFLGFMDYFEPLCLLQVSLCHAHIFPSEKKTKL